MKMYSHQIVSIAILAHGINRAYCESTHDYSQPSWSDAPDWQKESACEGVKAHLESPLTPQESHQSWLDQKEKDGWVYGEAKDPEAKTHPCMVPYSDLPERQKVKDFLFGACVALGDALYSSLTENSINAKDEPSQRAVEELPITEGMYRVGIDFNPGGHEQVTHLKTGAAMLIDYVLENGVDPRTAALAATGFEQACMDGVKSVTKPPRPDHLK